MVHMICRHLLHVLLAAVFLQYIAEADPVFQVPDGFAVERVAGPTNVVFPMFAAFDDRGRLFVTESSGLDLYAELQNLTRRCRISLLEDKDGDGTFEHQQVFADKLVFPMGVAWRDGKLYVPDPPDLVVYEDADGDGRADKRRMLLTGFGHTDNGSLHGLTFGPDGWLYMTMGQPDGYRLKRPDGTFLEGKSGALIRCKPDGSDVEVVSRGFENLVEIDFMPAGEIIGTDNWFSLPSEGIRDALVHLVDEGLYPIQLKDSGTPFLVSGDPLPPIVLYPAVALSGMVRYKGAAFPPAMRDSLFSAQFNTRKIVRHQLLRKGDSFESVDQDFLVTQDPDFHPSDVLEDADGSLIVIDTGSWYVHHCPTGRIRHAPAQGGIYRIRTLNKTVDDPYGAALSWDNVQPNVLVQRLKDSRPAVQERAVSTLVKLGSASFPALETVLAGAGLDMQKERAIWILSRITNPSTVHLLISLLTHEDAETVVLVARALGRSAAKQAESQLAALLRHSAAHVRHAAAEALADCGSSQCVPWAIEALAANPGRFEEHALIHVLYEWADTQTLRDSLRHSHPRVRKAALLLLDQSPRQVLRAEDAVQHLFASDEALARAARFILRKHPTWISQAIPELRRLVDSSTWVLGDNFALREFISSFGTNPEVASLVAAYFNMEISDAGRLLLLESMAQNANDKIPDVWKEAVISALASKNPAVLSQAVRSAMALQLHGLQEKLNQIANSPQNPDLVRLEALRAVIRQRPQLSLSEFEFLQSQLVSAKGGSLRLSAADIITAAQVNASQLAGFLNAVAGDRIISPGPVLELIRRTQFGAESAQSVIRFLNESVKAGFQPSDEHLRWLESHLPESYAEQIGVVRRDAAGSAGRQLEELKRLEGFLEGGDPNRGHELFLGKAGCASCHRVGKQGGLVGPDLTKIGAIRSGRDLIESLVMPSATFAQGYDSYSVKLKNGDEITGVRVRQPDESIVLRDASSTEFRLDESQIQSIERLKVSLMPEGLLQGLKPEEIRDLLNYLKGLK